jgi:hypothetical protein
VAVYEVKRLDYILDALVWRQSTDVQEVKRWVAPNKLVYALIPGTLPASRVNRKI